MSKSHSSKKNTHIDLTKRADETERTVLVVEDDGTHRKYMGEILKGCGFKVVPAENGNVALDKLSSGQHFDLIIMDWDMPEMNGLEATKAIRARQNYEGLSHIPVIAFTGHKDPGDRETCLAAGMDAYLSKEVWMPKWRDILIDNLQGLIAGTFKVEDFDGPLYIEMDEVIMKDFDLDAFDRVSLENSKKLLNKYFKITVQDYLEDAAKYIENISSGFDQNDRDAIARNAHPLKSNSIGMGLTAVSEVAKTIEHLAKNGEPLDRIQPLVSQIERAYELGAIKLQKEIEDLKS